MRKWTYIVVVCLVCPLGFWGFTKINFASFHHSNIKISIENNDNQDAITKAPHQSTQQPEQNQVATQAKMLYEEGLTAFSDKQYAKAIAFEQKAIKADNTYFDAFNVLGIAMCYSGDYTNGIANIEKALQMNPNDGYARFNRALALELYGHYDDAIPAYQYALELKSGDWWVPWCDYGIASIYGRRGDTTNTVRYLSQAIKLNGSIKIAARTEQDFDNVRNSSQFQALIR